MLAEILPEAWLQENYFPWSPFLKATIPLIFTEYLNNQASRIAI